MKPIELKISQIGNSRGVRLPAQTLKRYGMQNSVIMEERTEGILLRPIGKAQVLSWEATAAEMAKENEEWSDWSSTDGDGLENLEWK